MSPLRSSLLLSLVLAWLVGCGSSRISTPSGMGSAQLAVQIPEAPPGEVSRVTVTVSAPDMAPRSTDLALTGKTWGGLLGDLPSGPHRTFLTQAFDAANTLRYEKRAEDVTVTAGSTALLSFSLQQLSPAATASSQAPLIDALVSSSNTVLPGGHLSLKASASGPDAGSPLSFEWTSPSGTFSSPTEAATLWTAPPEPGGVDLTLTVSDSRGGSVAMRIRVDVSKEGSGAIGMTVDFNTAPRVLGLRASQSRLDMGQKTTLSVLASDAEEDTLSYHWSATCAGDFTDPDAASPTFIPSARPAAACNNCQLSVVVRDSRGGRNQGSLALCVSSPVTVNPGWTPAGLMVMPHQGHQMTLLAHGKVLVTGGGFAYGMEYPVGDYALAEVFDPATGAWSRTGSMNSWRVSHTATLLNDGRVLAVGGLWGDTSAELYDPVTGTWSPTGSMALQREWHTATLLRDGRVLVAGGSGNNLLTELYDPATGTWSPTGSMSAPRNRHTATLLPDGKVLVAGGDALAAAELYDPTTGLWSRTGSMSARHFQHAAVLLPEGKVLVMGGEEQDGGPPLPPEMYDPATGSWTPAPPMARQRSYLTATLLPNGKVLAVGGYYYSGVEATAELFDPVTRTWSWAGSMSMPRADHRAVLLLTGQVLVTGTSFNLATGPTELFTP